MIVRSAATVATVSPAALLSGSHVAAVILASAGAAAIILPLVARGLQALPTWGREVHEWREEVRASRQARRRKRRASRRARRRQRTSAVH